LDAEATRPAQPNSPAATPRAARASASRPPQPPPPLGVPKAGHHKRTNQRPPLSQRGHTASQQLPRSVHSHPGHVCCGNATQFRSQVRVEMHEVEFPGGFEKRGPAGSGAGSFSNFNDLAPKLRPWFPLCATDQARPCSTLVQPDELVGEVGRAHDYRSRGQAVRTSME
jgi:hypothetical protein